MEEPRVLAGSAAAGQKVTGTCCCGSRCHPVRTFLPTHPEAPLCPCHSVSNAFPLVGGDLQRCYLADRQGKKRVTQLRPGKVKVWQLGGRISVQANSESCGTEPSQMDLGGRETRVTSLIRCTASLSIRQAKNKSY